MEISNHLFNCHLWMWSHCVPKWDPNVANCGQIVAQILDQNKSSNVVQFWFRWFKVSICSSHLGPMWSKLWVECRPNYGPIMVQIIHLWLNKKILYHTYFNFFQQYVVQCGLIVVQIEMWRLNRLFNCHFGNVVPIVFPKWNPNVVQIVIQLWL